MYEEKQTDLQSRLSSSRLPSDHYRKLDETESMLLAQF